MKEKVKFYGSIFILIVFIPYLVTVYLHGSIGGLFSGNGEDEQLEQQTVSQLAAQIPADYEMECLKAQAVIARTNLYREMEEAEAAGNEESGESDVQTGSQSEETAGSEGNESAESMEESSSSDAGWSEEQMRSAWGEDYERNLEKLETAVSETEGEILTFDGDPIQAAYHTASSGKTRNAEEVPGQEEYTYLQSVDSEEDIQKDGFLYIGYMGKEDFAAALQPLFSGETVEAGQLPGALQIVKRDSAGYVTQVQYGSTIVNGEAVRSALGLNSACFYFSELEGKIRIVTKGIGHGLGFSQYGAEQKAERGWDYEELLEYYYRDVKIQRIK